MGSTKQWDEWLDGDDDAPVGVSIEDQLKRRPVNRDKVEAMKAEMLDYEMDFGPPNPVVVPRTYTEAELREAKAEGWEKGVTAGLAWDENRGEDFNTPNPYRSQP